MSVAWSCVASGGTNLSSAATYLGFAGNQLGPAATKNPSAATKNLVRGNLYGNQCGNLAASSCPA